MSTLCATSLVSFLMYMVEKCNRVHKTVVLVLYNIFINDLRKDKTREICMFAPVVKHFFRSSDTLLVRKKTRKASPN